MILADKIMNERKRNGWSQEELADRLSVSRQSVSKWEGAQAVPDLQKIVKMAELFGVSTDYLLKDELETDGSHVSAEKPEVIREGEPIKRVSMEEAHEFLRVQKKNGSAVANAVTMCITSPVLLILLAGLTEVPKFGISEAAAVGFGLIALLGMVAVAVGIFIVCGERGKRFEYIGKESIDTEYGVTGMVTELRRKGENTHLVFLVGGIALCIFSVLPLIIAALLEVQDYILVAMTGLLLVLVSVGVNLIIRDCYTWESYAKLLQEKEYSRAYKKQNRLLDKIAGVYWSLATAVYLIWSFITFDWGFTWIVWPISGILYGVVVAVVQLFAKDED